MLVKLSYLQNKMNGDKFFNLRKRVEKFASRFKNISILFFACSGNTKLYNIGIDTATIITAPIIYFLSIPAVNSIIHVATQNAIAVP